MIAGLAIFAATYLLIAVQRLPFIHLNRPAASLVGAVAMVVAGVLTPQQAYAAIDLDVIVFLLGLMLIVGYLEVGKFFEWAADAVMRRAFRDELARPFPEEVAAAPVALDRPLVTKGLAAFGVAVVAWLAGASLPGEAIAAGALMVLVAQRDPGEAIERVDWDLLLFFASLFVVMRGLEATGAVGWIDRRALALAQGASPWRDATVVSGVMVALSNLISNVPAVILWRGTVPTLPDPAFVWRIVAMSAPFAGNLLLTARWRT